MQMPKRQRDNAIAQFRHRGSGRGAYRNAAALMIEVEAKTWEAAGYRRDDDRAVHRLRSLPGLSVALVRHRLGRL
jgi:hypothetical protein